MMKVINMKGGSDMTLLYYILFLVLPVALFLFAGLVLGADAMVLAILCAVTLIALLHAIIGGGSGPNHSIR